jgi:hypothetical protein
MKLTYGSYEHADTECTLQIHKDALENPGGQQYGERVTWNIRGQLHAADTAALVSAIRALEAAYSQWYQDLVFRDGALTVFELANRGSLTGVKIIKRPSFPNLEGAQLTTYVDYEIVATADYPVSTQNPLKAFSETLVFSGGGPRRTAVECVNVPPQEQVLTAFTAYRAIQSGQAVGLTDYPLVPPPLFPGKLEETPEIQRVGPRLQNSVHTDFSVSWTYRYISATPLFGLPNAWPAG